jgi:hypothetical protein
MTVAEKAWIASMPDAELVGHIIGAHTVMRNSGHYTADAVSHASHWHELLTAEARRRGLTKAAEEPE